MKISDFKSHFLSQREMRWGLCYFLFESLCLSGLLQALNALLPKSLPQLEVNFLFFLINFLLVGFLFRSYLLQQVKLLPDVFEKVILVTPPAFVLYWLSNFLMTQALLAMDEGFYSINDVTIRQMVSEDYTLMLLGTVIFVPVAEECLFRGLLFRGLYDRSPVLGWLVSVAAFSAVHILGYIGTYPPLTLLLCFVQYVPAGICLAGAYRLSGSIFAPILLHALVNLLGMLVLR